MPAILPDFDTAALRDNVEYLRDELTADNLQRTIDAIVEDQLAAADEIDRLTKLLAEQNA